MNRRLGKVAVPLLTWSVGLVVLLESWQFAFSDPAARVFAHTGLPPWIRPTLGGVEILAALAFLVPVTRVVGGYALLVVFAVAVVIHVVHGWYNVGGLLVYGMAVIVSLAQRQDQRGTGIELNPVAK